MNALVALLQLVFGFLGFLLSPVGVFTVLAGLVAFIALPVIPLITGGGKRLANLSLGLGASALGRIAIVVTEHDDLLLKPMTFDDIGVEKISFGDETKEFEDPAGALHYWMGGSFALADEVRGVLFDPRHAALGTRKNEAAELGEWAAKATSAEWESYGVEAWRRGVFEFPRAHELVNLSAIRHLVDGGERAEYPKRIEELYKHSRNPLQDSAGATRFMLILAALLGPFAMMWLLATQGSTGGGGSTTVGFGGALLAVIGLSGVSKRSAAAAVLGGGIPLAIIALVAVLVSPFTAIFVILAAGIGFLFIPLASIVARLHPRLAQTYGRFMFKHGLMAYDRPVWEWTPQKYRLREYRDLDGEGDVTWYGLAGNTVGFTFDPSPDSWGAEVMDRDGLRRDRAVTDGGTAKTHIPEGYSALPGMTRGGTLGGFVPTDLDADSYYLNSAIAMSRFADSANGEKSLNRLLYSKEKHGEGGGLSDRTIIYAMAGCGLVSTALGVFVFFL